MTLEGLLEDINRGKIVGEILIKSFNDPNKGIFGNSEMPEAEPPENIDRGSEKHLQFVTLVVSIDYEKDAHRLWQNTRNAYNNSEFSFLFDLEKVIKTDEKIIASALKKLNVTRYPNREANAWKRIADAILTEMDGNITNYIKSCNYSGIELLNKIRSKKQKFPYLSGNKIAPLWIRMLYDVCNVPFKDMDKIPIPVDVHIARATFTTGCISGTFNGKIKDLISFIQDYWFKVASTSKFKAYEFDEPLWTLSKFGCKYYQENGCKVKQDCPVGEYCVKGTIKVSQENGVQIDSNQ